MEKYSESRCLEIIVINALLFCKFLRSRYTGLLRGPHANYQLNITSDRSVLNGAYSPAGLTNFPGF